MIIEKEVFAILGWFLWNRRNAIHFGHSVHPTTNIIDDMDNIANMSTHWQKGIKQRAKQTRQSYLWPLTSDDSGESTA